MSALLEELRKRYTERQQHYETYKKYADKAKKELNDLLKAINALEKN